VVYLMLFLHTYLHSTYYSFICPTFLFFIQTGWLYFLTNIANRSFNYNVGHLQPLENVNSQMFDRERNSRMILRNWRFFPERARISIKQFLLKSQIGSFYVNIICHQIPPKSTPSFFKRQKRHLYTFP
jgi:hypothetical protein